VKARAIAIGILRLYKSFISPLLPSACRFYPSCSAYAMQAVETRGVLRGAVLALWRLARCQPFTKGGYDPVPPTRTDS
jgi:putative membrane protein insertion efficiency factor